MQNNKILFFVQKEWDIPHQKYLFLLFLLLKGNNKM